MNKDDRFDVVRRFREVTDTVLLSVSGGKDSIAALALLAKYDFQITGAFYWVVPGIRFVENYLAYLERRFKIEILRIPHPAIAYYANVGAYRMAAKTPLEYTFKDAEQGLREITGIEWMAGGEKMVDSLPRRGMLHSCEGISEARKRAYPLATWNDHDVYSFIRSQGLMMPPDYNLFRPIYERKKTHRASGWGGTIEGEHLELIKARYPEDYARILEHYPLADAAIIKAQMQRQWEKEEAEFAALEADEAARAAKETQDELS